MDKKISVIIPIYNAEKYLKQTLDSIRFQTYKNLQIICVLDCPTDNSAEIAKKIAKEDTRIKLIYNPQNIGQANTRNVGVKNAAGEYIHFMDSDDFISPDFYEDMIGAITTANADVAACSIFYEKKPKQSIWFRKNEVLFGADKIKKTEVIYFGGPVRYLIKKNFWQERNFSFPDLSIMEDIAVIVPMIYYADKLALCPNAVYFYKNRENSILNKNDFDAEFKKIQKEHIKKASEILRNFMRAHKIKRPNKFYRILNKRAGKTLCLNAPIEYGKIDKKISVIIPIYNAEKYLKQTLDSIRFQTYKNMEIVCVLDCPTDNSAKIAEEIAKKDDRIVLVYSPQNIGLPASRNIGVENATGEYMHFIDSDDLISPDFYEIMISAAVNADADVAACSVFYEKKPWRSIWYRESEVLCGPSKIEKTEVAIMGWAWRYLIRKKFWKDNNFLFPNLVPMEDMPVMIPVIYYANKVALCPSAVYFYKYRENSILNNNYNPEREKLHSENRKKARKIFRDFMRDNNIKRPNRLSYYIKKEFA